LPWAAGAFGFAFELEGGGAFAFGAAGFFAFGFSTTCGLPVDFERRARISAGVLGFVAMVRASVA